MKLKGIDKFLAKIPKYSGKKIIILPLYCFLVFTISLIIQIFFDLLPTLIPVEGSIAYVVIVFPVLGVALMEAIAILLVFQMWYNRDRLKSKYGPLSYQRIFLVGFGGVLILMSIMIHSLILFYLLNFDFWSQFPFSIFASALTSFFTPISLALGYTRLLLGVFFCVVGLLTMIRAVFTFGIDYMTVVYLYFPEESEIQDHRIYSVLRHPAYSGIILMCLGGMIINFSLYSILLFLIFYIGMYIHIHFVEEKELVKRFGESYEEYREKTPAFFVQVKNWVLFFKFILGRK